MTIYEYLRGNREPVPDWLEQFQPGESFSRQHFFSSRIVYYPGSGTDGHPVKVFGSTHSAHCFVYTDYGLTSATVETQLEHPTNRFRGYHTLYRLALNQRDLSPSGWVPHIDGEEERQDQYRFAKAPPFAFLEVLERDPELNDDHGAHRLAILLLGADAIATYDALFCQEDSLLPPFAVVLQDHGFGGNYDRFGRGGLLDQVATSCNVFPDWLLVAKNTEPWHGFFRVPNVEGECGGSHATLRLLYERKG